MKVISLRQPWATLVVMGAKKIETRSWQTKYRGPLLIHASASKSEVCRSITLDFQQQFYDLQISHYKDMPLGAIIGQVLLVETIPSTMVEEGFGVKVDDVAWHFTDQELAFGDFSSNRYGWLLSDPVQFKQPIPAKGKLSIWDFDMPTS